MCANNSGQPDTSGVPALPACGRPAPSVTRGTSGPGPRRAWRKPPDAACAHCPAGYAAGRKRACGALPHPDPGSDPGSWGRALRRAREREEAGRLWQELLPCLPESARRLWAVLDSPDMAWRLFAFWGGRTLRVPCTLPPRGHRLRRRLGVDCLTRLMAAYGGTELYVPRLDGLRRHLQQQEIIAEYGRHTARGASSVSAVARLAARHGLSDRRIWQILKQEASPPARIRQLRRFLALATAGDEA